MFGRKLSAYEINICKHSKYFVYLFHSRCMQAFGRQLLGLFSRHVAASAGEEIGEGTRAV